MHLHPPMPLLPLSRRPLLPLRPLLLLLSRPSRRYFRIGAAAQAAPGTEDIPVRSSGSRRPPRDNKDWDPWDLPDKR